MQGNNLLGRLAGVEFPAAVDTVGEVFGCLSADAAVASLDGACFAVAYRGRDHPCAVGTEI